MLKKFNEIKTQSVRKGKKFLFHKSPKVESSYTSVRIEPTVPRANKTYQIVNFKE